MQLVAAHFEVQLFTEHTNHTHIFSFLFLSFSFLFFHFFLFFLFVQFFLFFLLSFFLSFRYFVISFLSFFLSFCLSVSLSTYASISTQTRVYTHVWPMAMYACMFLYYPTLSNLLTFIAGFPWFWLAHCKLRTDTLNGVQPRGNGVSSLVGYHHAAAAAAAAAVGAAEHNYLVLIAMMTWQ